MPSALKRFLAGRKKVTGATVCLPFAFSADLGALGGLCALLGCKGSPLMSQNSTLRNRLPWVIICFRRLLGRLLCALGISAKCMSGAAAQVRACPIACRRPVPVCQAPPCVMLFAPYPAVIIFYLAYALFPPARGGWHVQVTCNQVQTSMTRLQAVGSETSGPRYYYYPACFSSRPGACAVEVSCWGAENVTHGPLCV